MSDKSNAAGCGAIIGFSVVILMFLGSCLVSVFGGLMPDYSEGERTGELIKVSKKGVFFKSFEGQLVLNQFAIGKEGSNLFQFSTLDDKVGEDLSKLIGKKVVVKYHQYLIGPIQQSTDITITEVMEIK